MHKNIIFLDPNENQMGEGKKPRIQEQSPLESQKLSEKIFIEQIAQLQCDRNIKQGLRI